MKDIKALFQMLLVALFVGAIVIGISQLIVPVFNAFTLPERISSENAQNASDAVAAPTFTALRVQATMAAIHNEQTLAQAAASAQTVQAQGSADSARMTASTWQMLATGSLILVIIALVTFGALVAFRTHLAAQSTRAALHLVSTQGGTLQLPDRTVIQLEPQPQAQLHSGAPAHSSTPIQQRVPVTADLRITQQ